jgi:hypothetical protein
MSSLPLIGERFQNKAGHWFTIIEANHCLDITVKFDHRGFIRKTKTQYIRDKSVKLPSLFIGDSFKDKVGNTVVIKDIDTTSRITFEWEDGYTRVCQSSVLKNGTLMREEDSRQLTPSIKVGDIFTNNQGSLMVVKEYNNAANIIIEFNDPVNYSVKTNIGNIKSGNVHNKYLPTVAGVGVIGDFNVDINSKMYKSWCGMLKRVYNPQSSMEKLTYEGCSVQAEWLNIKNFSEWFDNQVVQDDWHLDKDLLIKGNREYSEKACVFLPREINSFLTDRHNHRGDWPVGVTYHERLNKWQASCNFKGKSNYLGVFSNPEDAFHTYKKYKEACAKNLAEQWKNIISERAIIALLNYEVDIQD